MRGHTLQSRPPVRSKNRYWALPLPPHPHWSLRIRLSSRVTSTALNRQSLLTSWQQTKRVSNVITGLYFQAETSAVYDWCKLEHVTVYAWCTLEHAAVASQVTCIKIPDKVLQGSYQMTLAWAAFCYSIGTFSTMY